MTEREIAFAAALHGPTLDHGKVRLVDGAPTRAVTFRRAPRPRTTCREKILPPRGTEIVTTKPAAVALLNRILFDEDWYAEDYLPGYPDEITLIAAMLLAHELTHVWQWQNRATTGYSPLKALREHGGGKDPYLFDPDGPVDFLSYGYEQQGAIVEEYVCCRALHPDGARTARLHGMLEKVMDPAPLPASREHRVRVPWDGVQVASICS